MPRPRAPRLAKPQLLVHGRAGCGPAPAISREGRDCRLGQHEVVPASRRARRARARCVQAVAGRRAGGPDGRDGSCRRASWPRRRAAPPRRSSRAPSGKRPAIASSAGRVRPERRAAAPPQPPPLELGRAFDRVGLATRRAQRHRRRAGRRGSGRRAASSDRGTVSGARRPSPTSRAPPRRGATRASRARASRSRSRGVRRHVVAAQHAEQPAELGGDERGDVLCPSRSSPHELDDRPAAGGRLPLARRSRRRAPGGRRRPAPAVVRDRRTASSRGSTASTPSRWKSTRSSMRSGAVASGAPRLELDEPPAPQRRRRRERLPVRRPGRSGRRELEGRRRRGCRGAAARSSRPARRPPRAAAGRVRTATSPKRPPRRRSPAAAASAPAPPRARARRPRRRPGAAPASTPSGALSRSNSACR